jgi:hypothetical protein
MHSVSRPVPASPDQPWPEQAKQATGRHPGRWPAVTGKGLNGLLIRGRELQVSDVGRRHVQFEHPAAGDYTANMTLFPATAARVQIP